MYIVNESFQSFIKIAKAGAAHVADVLQLSCTAIEV